MTDVRVTQLIKEAVVTEAAPDHRITSAVIEIVRADVAPTRVTSAAIEVLRSVGGASITSTAATVLCIATAGGD